MIIYPKEIDAGLGEILSHSTSIAYQSEINLKQIEKPKIDRAIAYSVAGQPDLYDINSILVSTGWNINDDVFDAGEVWSAKSSPIHKQFNYMHKENDIIGVIVDSFAFALDGTEIKTEDYPSQYDVLTAAVIYTKWEDDALQERMDKLIAEIGENKWFVSMECIFRNFDYAFASLDGTENFIVSRSEETSHLTKQLRTYGGSGTYNGYKIGRLLRKITFSGKGLVNNPANPRSVIFNDTNIFEATTTKASINSGEENMPQETDNSLVADLQKEISILKSDAAEAQKASQAEVARKIENYEEKVNELNTSLASKDTEIKELNKVVASATKESKDLTDQISKLEEEKEELSVASKTQERINLLISAGIESAKAEETVEKWISATDEQFTDIVALTSEAAFNFDKKDKDDKDKKDADKKKTDKKDKKDDKTKSDIVGDITPDDADEAKIVEDEDSVALASAGDDKVDGIKEELRAIASSALNL